MVTSFLHFFHLFPIVYRYLIREINLFCTADCWSAMRSLPFKEQRTMFRRWLRFSALLMEKVSSSFVAYRWMTGIRIVHLYVYQRKTRWDLFNKSLVKITLRYITFIFSSVIISKNTKRKMEKKHYYCSFETKIFVCQKKTIQF